MANTGVERSQQQRTIREWIKNVLGLVIVALLLLVLIKVLALSRDMEDSRRSLNELTNKLVKTQREIEDLRKQLGNTNAKVEIILRKFSSAQKVSQVRKRVTFENDKKPKHKCHKVNACLRNFTKEQQNCASIRNCMPERKQDFLQLYGIGVSEMINNLEIKEACKNIFWQNVLYDENNANNENNARAPDKIDIKINRNGTYLVYCNIRVDTKYINKVSIKLRKDNSCGEETPLFSSSLTYNGNNSIYEVKFFGLEKIKKGTKLFVQYEFTEKVLGLFSSGTRTEWLKILFPDNNPNFGVFLVD